MPTSTSTVRISQLNRSTYVVQTGPRHVLFIKYARIVLRRARRFMDRWLKYIEGVLSDTGERITVCLGEAAREEVNSWVHTSNGGGLMLCIRLFEFGLRKLGVSKMLAIMILAVEKGVGNVQVAET